MDLKFVVAYHQNTYVCIGCTLYDYMIPDFKCLLERGNLYRHLKKVPPWPLFESPKASDWISSILWWERTLRIDGLSVSYFQDNSKFWGGANLQNAFTELMDSVADQAGNNSCNKDGCAYPPQPSRPRPRPCHNSEPPEYGDSGQVRVPAVTHGCGTGRKERL